MAKSYLNAIPELNGVILNGFKGTYIKEQLLLIYFLTDYFNNLL